MSRNRGQKTPCFSGFQSLKRQGNVFIFKTSKMGFYRSTKSKNQHFLKKGDLSLFFGLNPLRWHIAKKNRFVKGKRSSCIYPWLACSFLLLYWQKSKFILKWQCLFWQERSWSYDTVFDLACLWRNVDAKAKVTLVTNCRVLLLKWWRFG